MENQGCVREDVKLSYTLPKPSKNARLFVLCLRVMYMIVLEAAKHATVTYNLGNLADWLSAIGTIAAVIVALFFNYYGFLRKDVSELSKEIKEFNEEINSVHGKKLDLLDNLIDFVEFVNDDKNILSSKEDYLRAIVPTLKEIQKDLLNNPLAQYKATRIIRKINECDSFNEALIFELSEEIFLIGKTYRDLIRKEQTKIDKKTKELNKRFQQLTKRIGISKKYGGE